MIDFIKQICGSLISPISLLLHAPTRGPSIRDVLWISNYFD